MLRLNAATTHDCSGLGEKSTLECSGLQNITTSRLLQQTETVSVTVTVIVVVFARVHVQRRIKAARALATVTDIVRKPSAQPM